jgi:hypothetical protein
MKHTHGLLLGCILTTGVAHATFARAQVELTCRVGDTVVASASALFVELDCTAAARNVGIALGSTLNFDVIDANTASFTVSGMGAAMYTCFQENGRVRVVGPVRNRGDRTCPQLTGGGGGGVGGSPRGYCPNQVEGDVPCEGQSPIVLDLSRSGFSFTSVKDGVDFDIDGDGMLERTAWTARGSDDAFLAMDRNGNGTIDGGRELFGDVTILLNGKTGAHGYIALAELDLEANGGNGNGYVDSADRGFRALLLWTDRDHDGRSSPAELGHLSDRGIFAIALDADESDVVDEHGNRLAYVAPAYAWNHFRIERIRTTDIFFGFRELKK